MKLKASAVVSSLILATYLPHGLAVPKVPLDGNSERPLISLWHPGEERLQLLNDLLEDLAMAGDSKQTSDC